MLLPYCVAALDSALADLKKKKNRLYFCTLHYRKVKMAISYSIDFIDSDYKSDNFEGGAGRSLKSFLRDFGNSVLEKNVKILEGVGALPIVLSEKSSYSSIGSALHDLTPYVQSEVSLKKEIKNPEDATKSKTDRYVDFWCMDKKKGFEIWLEAKLAGFNIGKGANWECGADLVNTLKDALDQLKTLKNSNAEQTSENANVFRIALLNNVVYYTKGQKSDDADIEAAPKYIHKAVAEAARNCAKSLRIKGDVHILTSVLDLHTFTGWEDLGYYECPYVLLHMVVFEGLK